MPSTVTKFQRPKVQIEAGVPIPRSAGERKTVSRPHLTEMKVGDSYFLPNRTHANSSFVRMESRFERIPITVRTVTENGVKGIRVWRIG